MVFGLGFSVDWEGFADRLWKDTEGFYTEVQEKILARYNKTFDWSLKAIMMGKKAIEAARIFVEETGNSDSLSAEDFLEERESMLQSMFPSSELMPESPAIVKSYYDNRIVGCPGDEGEDEHDVVWFGLKKDHPFECPVCTQYFKASCLRFQ